MRRVVDSSDSRSGKRSAIGGWAFDLAADLLADFLTDFFADFFAERVGFLDDFERADALAMD